MFNIKRKNLIYLVFFIILFSVLTVLYSSNRVMITLPIFLDTLTNKSLSLKNKSEKIMHFFEKINPLKSKVALSRFNLPELNIFIKNKNISKINKNIQKNINNSLHEIFKFDYLNDYVKAELSINDKKYEIDMKLHGTSSFHFINKKKSFKIRLKNKNQFFYKDMKSFNLVIPDELSQVAVIGNSYLPSLLSMQTPQIFPVILKVNNENFGLYYLEENLSKEYLEKTDRKGYDLITSSDDKGHQYNANHFNPFNTLTSNAELKNFSGLNIGQLNEFSRLMKIEKFDDFKNLLNLDEFAKFQAINALVFDYGHSMALDNLRLLYDTNTGKFSPHIRIESVIENIYSYNARTIDRGLVFSDNIFGLMASDKHFMYKLTKNNEFRTLRNKYLHDLILKKNEILNFTSQLIKKHNKYIYADNSNALPSRVMIHEREQILEKLQNNIIYSQRYLNYSRLFVDINKIGKNKYKLEINADSNDQLVFNKFKIQLTKNENISNQNYINIESNNGFYKMLNKNDRNGEYFDLSNILNQHNISASLDRNLEPIPNPLTLIITINENYLIKNIEINSLTKISKKETSNNNIYTYINNNIID